MKRGAETIAEPLNRKIILRNSTRLREGVGPYECEEEKQGKLMGRRKLRVSHKRRRTACIRSRVGGYRNTLPKKESWGGQPAEEGEKISSIK